jgi:hypothetical protein
MSQNVDMPKLHDAMGIRSLVSLFLINPDSSTKKKEDPNYLKVLFKRCLGLEVQDS